MSVEKIEMMSVEKNETISVEHIESVKCSVEQNGTEFTPKHMKYFKAPFGQLSGR